MLSKETVNDTRPVKICGVCGDHAKSYHFGGISCDSCKAFFRRSVQNDAYKTFQCAFCSKCDITMANRKCCQYCRFQKCLDIGMETSWVMSEEERVHLLRTRMEKRRREKNPADGTSSPPSTPAKRSRLEDVTEPKVPVDPEEEEEEEEGDRQRGMDVGERREVDTLVALFRSWFRVNECSRNGKPVFVNGRSKWMLLVQFVVSVHKLVRFARGVVAFSSLPLRDQVSLLRANLFEMFLAIHFSEVDPGRCFEGRPPPEASSPLAECPFLLAVDSSPAEKDVPWHDSSFRTVFRTLVPDTDTLVLLLVVILFSCDSAELRDEGGIVEACQVRHCHLLSKYVKRKKGTREGSRAWPRLLLLLPTLREIREKHVSYQFDVHDEDLAIAKQWMFNSVEKDLLHSVICSSLNRSYLRT